MSISDDALAILGRIGNNAQNLDLLLKHLHGLVPFVGAGLSSDFDYPSWNKLLEDLADQAGLRNEVERMLANNQFEEAAEKVATTLPNLFDDTLRNIFDHKKLARPLAKGAVRHIPAIARGPVLTTNLDRVLEAAFHDAARPFAEVFPGFRIREASRAVQLDEPFLLKLHGDYYDAESRVLTLTEYSREYGSSDPDKVNLSLPLPKILVQALGSRPLLFLGCSLKMDRTVRLIAKIARNLPGTIHFALLPDCDNILDRRKELYSWNIRPLFFPTGQYEKVDQFLAFLAKGDHQSTQTVALKLTKRKRFIVTLGVIILAVSVTWLSRRWSSFSLPEWVRIEKDVGASYADVLLIGFPRQAGDLECAVGPEDTPHPAQLPWQTSFDAKKVTFCRQAVSLVLEQADRRRKEIRLMAVYVRGRDGSWVFLGLTRAGDQ
jgi:hypothetical protein